MPQGNPVFECQTRGGLDGRPGSVKEPLVVGPIPNASALAGDVNKDARAVVAKRHGGTDIYSPLGGVLGFGSALKAVDRGYQLLALEKHHEKLHSA